MATLGDGDGVIPRDTAQHAVPTAPVRLQSLYVLNAHSQDDTILRNLTRVTTPAVLCQIERDGVLVPSLSNEPGYLLLCTFSKLLLVPVLRIECRFSRDFKTNPIPYLTLLLEFHFCNFGISGHRLTDYSQSKGRVSFTATDATSAGFNKITGAEHHFGDSEREVVALLKEYRDAEEAKHIVLKLHDYRLSESELYDIENVRSHLPGGDKSLLPSLRHKTEYHAVAFDPRPWTPHLRGHQPEHVMVSLDCFDFFTTVDEACAQLAHSARVLHDEEHEALRLWASVSHSARLYRCNNSIVLAVNFEQHPTLGNDKSNFKLPKSLEVKVISRVLGLYEKTGRLSDDYQELPRHHAVFRMSDSSHLYERASDPNTMTESFKVRLVPHENKFAADAHEATVTDLRRAEHFHETLLNQRHDKIENVDTTAKSDFSTADRQALDLALRKCKPWNAEQLQVIDSVTSAKGKFSVIMGTAGTGKTTLHKALGLYYYCLGYHVLSLGPANADANHIASEMTAEELRREFPDWDLSSFNDQFLRLFSGSKDISVKKITESQLSNNTAGHEGGGVVSLQELAIALDEEEKLKGSVQEYGILQALIHTAREGRFPDQTPATGSHWTQLADMIARYRRDGLGLRRCDLSAKYAYITCKGELIQRNRFMITTTGNVRSAEMVGSSSMPRRHGMETEGNWYIPTQGVPHKGVIVLIDEATSDLELNLWSAIVCEQWADAVEGVFLFGDDKQIRPPNKAAEREVQYNCYLERLSISLPSRLKREGWPTFELKEQYRMHQCIADFPNRMVYDGQLRNGPITSRTLDSVKPGLRSVLTDIITEHGMTNDAERAQYRLEASDAKARLHWIEVLGTRVKHLNSTAVKEHVEVVFTQIMPKLREYFKSRGEKLAEEVMVLVAHAHAATLYKEEIHKFVEANQGFNKDDDVPRVLTVDSSIGKEATMVIFDGSFQYGDEVGFLTVDGRANVAFTRASEVLWIVGGKMELKFKDKDRPTNLVKLYKDQLDSKGHSHPFLTEKQKADLTASGEGKDDDASDSDKEKRDGEDRGGRRGRGGRGDRGARRGRRGKDDRNCFNCGEAGHISRKCPSKSQDIPMEHERFPESTAQEQI